MSLKVVARVPDDFKHHYDVEALVVDGDELISGADDGKVKVWKTDNLTLAGEFLAHPDAAVFDLASRGDKVYTCGNDGKLKSWARSDWSLIKELLSIEDTVRKICISNGRVYAGDEKGNVHVLKEDDGSYVCRLELMEEVWDIKKKDNDLYTARDRGLTVSTLFENKSGPKLTVRNSIDGSAPICLSGDLLCLKSREGLSVDVWRNENNSFRKVATLMGKERLITAIATSYDGTKLYAAGWDNLLFAWDLQSFALEDTVELPECANTIAVSMNGDVFVGGTDGFIVKLSMC